MLSDVSLAPQSSRKTSFDVALMAYNDLRGYQCIGAAGASPYQTCFSIFLTGVVTATWCSSGVFRDFTAAVPVTLTTPYQTITGLVPGHGTTQTSSFTSIYNSTAVKSSFLFVAPLVQLNHRATDLPSSSTSSTANPTTTPPSSGLSTGAKAAIGVFVPVVVIALAELVMFLSSTRNQSNQIEYDFDFCAWLHEFYLMLNPQ